MFLLTLASTHELMQSYSMKWENLGRDSKMNNRCKHFQSDPSVCGHIKQAGSEDKMLPYD